MIALTDQQLAVIQQAAAALHPRDRGPFLERVAAMLQGHELGDGSVSRAARAAQKEFLRGGAPQLHQGKYAR
jgi:hypothetical protein